MFEQASRRKLRFETERGVLSVEDLWTISLTSARGVSLDGIARTLHRRMQDDDISFVDESRKSDADLQLSFDIVRHIIKVRVDEAKLAAEAGARAAEKQKILGIIAQAEEVELASKSLDELRAMAAAL